MSHVDAVHPAVFSLPYFCLRHVSSPEDLANGRRVYVGQTPIAAVVGLPDNENVRDYLLDAEGRQKRKRSDVHRAIERTLTNNPEDFSVLNGGLVLVARSCEIDEKNKLLRLVRPSIINGSQTQGVIRDFLRGRTDPNHTTDSGPHVKFELVETNDEDLIAEVSIARNFQIDVMPISIAGRLGQLDELERALQKGVPGARLRKSETDLAEDYVPTERLLQVIAALVPEELWVWDGEFSKVYTYSRRARCIKDFQEIYVKAKDRSKADYATFTRLYRFYLDIAPQALELYTRWKAHPEFYGTRLRAIQRGTGGQVLDVPDGIIFPILAALSVFAKNTAEGWRICPPEIFSDDELIKTAASIYQDIADSNPNFMGKSKSCYAALYQVTSIFSRLGAARSRPR